jgi:hypothetical protein
VRLAEGASRRGEPAGQRDRRPIGGPDATALRTAPEWFTDGSELYEGTCELLDVLGWDGNLRPQDATIDFPRHGRVLKAALEDILPLAEMQLAEVDANDAVRAERGEPARRDWVKGRMRALREFASLVERRSGARRG